MLSNNLITISRWAIMLLLTHVNLFFPFIYIDNIHRQQFFFYFHELLKQVDKHHFVSISVLFHRECKHILHFCDSIRILYLFSNVKKQQQQTTAKLSKNSRNKRRSNRLFGVLCEISSYTVTVYYRSSTSIKYQNNYFLLSDRI